MQLTVEMKSMRESGASYEKIAKKMGVAKSTVQDAFKSKGGKLSVKGSKDKLQAGRSLADFRKTYDKSTIIPERVRAAIGKLGLSGWEYEVQFAKMAGVGLSDLGRFRDQFSDFVVVIGRDSRRAWAGSKATARAMKEMLA